MITTLFQADFPRSHHPSIHRFPRRGIKALTSRPFGPTIGIGPGVGAILKKKNK